MSDRPLEPVDELADRLAALGRRPVDPAVQSQHLTAMSSVRTGRSVFRTSLAGRLKVGAGVMAGFLLGASGLTAAGAMGPLQPAAAKVAAEVANLDLPQGPKDKADKAKKAKKDVDGQGSIGTARDWANADAETPGCADNGNPGQYAGNRGQYLKQERAKGAEALAAAKASTCGMPLGGDDADDEAPEVEDTDEPKGAEGEGQGQGQGKDTAPGQLKDKDNDKDKADKGDDDGDEADDAKDDADEADDDAAKPETPAGPKDDAGNGNGNDKGADEPTPDAGRSGVDPPVVDPPAKPAPDSPDPATEDEV